MVSDFPAEEDHDDGDFEDEDEDGESRGRRSSVTFCGQFACAWWCSVGEREREGQRGEG